MSFEQDTPLLGFACQGDDEDTRKWEPFWDEETALHADINRLVFGDDRETCLTKLQQKFPCEDPRLSYVHEYWHYGYRSRTAWSQHDCITVATGQAPWYIGTNPLEALALAKELGTITCRALTYDEDCNHRRIQIDWEAAGCEIMHNGMSGRIQIDYVPDLIKRRLRAKARKKVRAQRVLVCDIVSMTYSVYDVVRNHVRMRHDWSCSSRYGACGGAMEAIKLLNMLHGKNAHRRHPAFRKLKEHWKKTAAASRSSMYNTGSQWSRDTIQRFCNFMAEEITVRNGKLHAGDTWELRIALESFDAYAHDAYVKEEPAADLVSVNKKEQEVCRST